ncbi:MAG: hypothetical protein DCF25_19200 [Leptolyngbya foveolarum]|uniref:Alpha/beta hydrolase n=1 Tax=Leptolyngbya foveolarum TaxID=47253 RepID=A0A2W4VH87_9CYAN|nr:MAG: hypothetical protein DCF25_19200 [Leptolyngbya foveolarum]
MSHPTQAKTATEGRYLLSVEDIPPVSSAFPAYFVGSTAPNNVEDGIIPVKNPDEKIREIAAFLCAQSQPELLIAIHGYNTALGEFATDDPTSQRRGVRGWYQDIRNHINEHCDRRSAGLVLIGYRWPSEEIKGGGNDSFARKIRYAQQSLPIFLRVILALAFAALGGLVMAAFADKASGSMGFSIFGVSLIVLATVLVSFVLTLFLLRVVGYLRDSYRASNYGVPDLVELIRQLNKAVLAATPHENWSERQHIKLSFIGHSMGGFVVTDTVRILSNVFDQRSIGNLGTGNAAKTPSAEIGSVFSLGRLVLVSPDIPAETIISGRANFLSSSLRRFEETYLFSNEGDMALRMASTSANYASFPAKTREGGYRLGNVVVRSPQEKIAKTNRVTQYGIVNFNAYTVEGGQLLDVQQRSQGGIEPKQLSYLKTDGSEGFVSSFLSYLYILRDKPLSRRQQDILEPDQKPIAELFTVFDCTDYYELLPGAHGKAKQKVGLLTYALEKRSLSFWNYVRLVVALFNGTIDSHGGYFYTAPEHSAPGKPVRPDARVAKQLIYGLACLGFKSFIHSLSAGESSGESLGKAGLVANRADPRASLRDLSQLCADRHIQVLLAAERYNHDILGIVTPSDRNGY